MIDTVIESRFKVKERLVRQGVIEVFEGTDLDEGLPVWIKFLGMPVAQDVEFVNNWRGQLLGVQSIHDRHLPRIISFGHTSDGTLYQIEEPPRGITLGRLRNQRTPMGVPESIKLVAAAARAVSVAHREGVAHGGLSPESIYIEFEGLQDSQLPTAFITHWELGELMIAAHHANLPLHGRLRPYLAPEQLSGTVPPPTPASDVYALGAILYELLTGSLPSLTQTTLPAPPSRFNPAVSLPVEQLLLRALSREPAARQPNGQALANALEQALAAPPVAPPNPLDSQPTPRLTESIHGERPPRRLGPLWVIVGTIAGLVMLCACILLIVAVAAFPWQESTDTAIPIPIPTSTLTGPEVTATALMNTIPNLKGPPYISYNGAVQEAWNRGFRVRIVAFRNDESENAPPPGVIVEQCPQPGAIRGADTSGCGDGRFGIIGDDMILVEVSSLPDPVIMRVVPDLYGQAEEQGRLLIEAGGLRVGTRLPAYDLLIPPGHIIEQSPHRGIAVLPGTPIDIVVSAGLPPTEQDAPLPLPDTSNNQPVGDGATDNPSTSPVVVPPAGTSSIPPVANTEVPASDVNPAYPAPNFSPTPVVAAATFTPIPTATQPQPTATPLPTASSTPPLAQEATPSPTALIDPSSQIVLLEDDFEEGNRLRWIMDEEKSSIEDGVFAVELQEPKEFWQSQPYDIGLFDDYSYQASVTFVDESSASQQEASAGLLFRTQGEEGFYFFEVNGLGEFRLRVQDGKELIEQLNWTSDPAILPSGATNELEVRVNAERIVLSINGEDVVDGYDMPPEFNFQFGGIGLAVQAGEEPLAVEFDNIFVSR